MTKRERIWRWLKARGPARRCDIASALRLSNNAVSVCLFHMRGEGYVDRTLNPRRVATWFAVGEDAPVCMSGTRPNTLRNLNQRRDVAMDRLRKAFEARGLDSSRLNAPPPPANDGCLLSQCWGISKSCKRAA